jgi:hypothetical protein
MHRLEETSAAGTDHHEVRWAKERNPRVLVDGQQLNVL